MKNIFTALLTLLSGFCFSQKYVLIDKKISQPISYTNTVTIENSYKNLFAVEKDKLSQFIAELEKISSTLTDKKKLKPEAINLTIGSTRFVGVKVPLAKEERMDVVLTTDCGGTTVSMHLCDSKVSNARNAYFINTWLKYIKNSIK